MQYLFILLTYLFPYLSSVSSFLISRPPMTFLSSFLLVFHVLLPYFFPPPLSRPQSFVPPCFSKELLPLSPLSHFFLRPELPPVPAVLVHISLSCFLSVSLLIQLFPLISFTVPSSLNCFPIGHYSGEVYSHPEARRRAARVILYREH